MQRRSNHIKGLTRRCTGAGFAGPVISDVGFNGMDYYEKILLVSSRDCIQNATAVRAMLEALNFHIELVAVNEQKDFDAVFGGKFICANHLLIQCHGVDKGLEFPLAVDDGEGNWTEKKRYLAAEDVAQLRSGASESAILALACSSGGQEIADVFRNSGFKYYIGHAGYNQIDSMVLYCAAFYCALRSSVRDDETKEFSIKGAHECAMRVQEFPNGTRGYRFYEIQQGA